MVQVRTEFTNEHGAEITIVISSDEAGATIALFSKDDPNPQAITLTPMEQRATRGLLWLLEPGYKTPPA